MEIGQLRAFLALADELHFGRAAERLQMAQPPLSRTIQQLEKELGTRLFDRTTRSVRLTPAGTALIKPARDILDACSAARISVQAAAMDDFRSIRVGFAGPTAQSLIRQLARQVRLDQPDIELVLLDVTRLHSAVDEIMAGEIDLGVARWIVQPVGIASRILAEEHYVLVVPEGHPLADSALLPLAEVADEKFVALSADPGSGARDAFISSAHAAGFVPEVVQTAPDWWTLAALVAAGVGIAFAVDKVLEEIDQHGIRVVSLEEGLPPTFARLAWRENDDRRALHDVLAVAAKLWPERE
jgi:DNA-binding transcriptional LysR family regulator